MFNKILNKLFRICENSAFYPEGALRMVFVSIYSNLWRLSCSQNGVFSPWLRMARRTVEAPVRIYRPGNSVASCAPWFTRARFCLRK
ncbi:hypothetical protein TREPR_2802 [Treponema primitia ZAS-2]|uniref:Uncharacterized protein n=1 Tax=Treponema primitia (strain ATCC BAA-887 / DSM 12427 / ZAS-2) TaxID=545694 RepID=F5YPY7_TREPZ|nr:hypothetical protein TREPR_2802 [Treponema primitia ZAS-2]